MLLFLGVIFNISFLCVFHLFLVFLCFPYVPVLAV